MPQRGFNPRCCLGWLDELVASHAGSCRPLLSTACDTARCNQPVIEGRDNSRPFLILSGPINNICTSRRLKVAPPCPSHPPLSLTSLTTCPKFVGLCSNTQLGHTLTSACCCRPHSPLSLFPQPRAFYTCLLIKNTILFIGNILFNLSQNIILILYKVDKPVNLQ